MSLFKINDLKCHYLTEISGLKGSELKHLGTEMQIIFQNPESSLNPRMKIYGSIAELLRLHSLCERDEEKTRVWELIETVSPNKEQIFRYPGELRGGQLKRVRIARIPGLKPKLIVAEESTSILDSPV